MLDFEQIKELIGLVSKHKLEKVEVERSGFRVEIVGRSAPALAAGATAAPLGEQGSAQLEAASETAAPPGAAPVPAPAAADAQPRHHILTSPIVGTFYAASGPEAEPYVRVGDRVKKGQVLCIVEAMKLMNEIESDADGVVAEIFPQNAQPVEFGERLFAIKTD